MSFDRDSAPFDPEHPPIAFDTMPQDRTFVIEADAETLERMRKVGHVRGFEVFSDEGPVTGGDSTAPSPLSYFTLAVGF